MARNSIDVKALKHDAFREKMFEWAELARRYRRWVITAAVALLLAVGAGFAYFGYASYDAMQQAEKFYEAERILTNLNLPEGERLANAKKALQAFLEAYPQANLSPYAWMFLAKISWGEQDLEGAGNAFAKVLGHGSTTPATRHLAIVGTAKLEEAKGRMSASEGLYRGLPDEPYRDLKDYSLGRLAAAGKRPREARKFLENVVKQQPPSPLAAWAGDALSFLP